MQYRTPFEVDEILNAIVRQVTGVDYAAPHVDPDEAEIGGVVVWNAVDKNPDYSLQNLIGTTHTLSFHVGAKGYYEARDLAGRVWAALMNAPQQDWSQVVPGTRLIAVRTSDSPVENRTPGQHLNFHEYRFTVYVTVGPT